MTKNRNILYVEGLEVAVQNSNYISLTDIARSEKGKRPDNIIANWLQNQKTLMFLETWEKVHNPDFNHLEMQGFRLKVFEERYFVSAKKYINLTNAIGIKSKAGRYGGTYAHKDIAINFCYWLSPIFQVYLIKEFERLKTEEQAQREHDWTIEKLLHNSTENVILLQSLQELRTAIENPKNQLEEE